MSEKKKTYKKRFHWKLPEEKVFIKIWRDHLPQLRSSKKNSHVYIEMIKHLEKEGICATPFETKMKCTNLTTKYRKEKANIAQSGGSPSDWPHYDTIHEMLSRYRFNQSLTDIDIKDEGDYMFLKSPNQFNGSQSSLYTMNCEDNESIASRLASRASSPIQLEKPLESQIINHEPTTDLILENEVAPRNDCHSPAFKPVVSVRKIKDPLHFNEKTSMQIENARSMNEDYHNCTHLDCIENLAKVHNFGKNFNKIIEYLEALVNKIPNTDEEFLRASLILMQDLPADAKTRVKNSLLEVILNERKNCN